MATEPTEQARRIAEEIQKYTFEVNGIRGGKSLDDIAAIVDRHFATALHEREEQIWQRAIEIAKQNRYWGGFLNNNVVAALQAAAQPKDES